MAPEKRYSVYTTNTVTDNLHSCRRSSATLAERRRRRRLHGRLVRVGLCWCTLRKSVLVRLTQPRRAADAAVKADVDRPTRRHCITVPSVQPCNRVQQRHLLTCLSSAALVNQLALQMSRLQLQAHAPDQDDTVSMLPADSAMQRVSASSKKHSRLSMSSASLQCSRRKTDNGLDTSQTQTSHDTRDTSMAVLLRYSCRIPRPVPVSVPV